MKKTDLERITNAIAQGSGEFTVTDSNGDERPYNIVGAINTITRIVDEMEKYGLAYSDLTDDQQEDLDLAQQALHHYEDELGSLLASFTGNDGAMEADDGTTLVDLPNAATSATKSASLPDVSS